MHRCSILATGWPSLSMWGGEEMSFGFLDPIESRENRAALVLGRQKPITASRAYGDIPDFLPLAPIWPGAIVNTLIYAAALAACFVAPRSLRRAVRSRRNRCTRCGYPSGTSERCPECGQQR